MSAAGASRVTRSSLKIGNESADLDSLCSALLLAYLRTHTPPHHTLHIPLSNLPRPDLALRPELTAVLAPAGLRPDDLITLSDLPPRGALEPRQDKGAVVVGCIDHHDDEGFVPRELEPGQPRVIERCGSCASLVVEHCREAWDALAHADGPGLTTCDDGTPAAECDVHLGHLALAPILVDTAALMADDKTTEVDVKVVEWLEGRMLASQASSATSASTTATAYDRAMFYSTLTRLKTSLQGLSYRDVLRKDYKRWSEGGDAPLAVGISSVPRSLTDTIREAGDNKEDRPSFFAALRAWAEEQQLDVAAVMTVFPVESGGIARELLIWGVNGRGAGVVGEFVRRFGGKLGLEKWDGEEMDEGGEGQEEWRVCWRQGEVRCSRKQVAPMLREAMKVVARL
ncbi:hypothetical protein VTJ49DRAFT_5063 [Mycothermus thermophilus]|uniref:DHHA2 domain-containing protein n=1 Tax=Humicola insolens TaxID=85995 RepID=A0ABR3V418_HUMIN